jgi:hypothetical protein
MGNYGDHSYDHDHGPAGYWDDREDEQREYERGREIRRMNHEDRRDEREITQLPPRDRLAEEAQREADRQREQSETDARVASMTSEQILKEIIPRFDLDANYHPHSPDVRCNIRMSYYNALRKRFFGGPRKW